MNCDAMKVEEESAWRGKHAHGDIVEEDYAGPQPPTYTLEQLCCLNCNAKLIRIRHREANIADKGGLDGE